jgi:hypothetical protein
MSVNLCGGGGGGGGAVDNVSLKQDGDGLFTCRVNNTTIPEQPGADVVVVDTISVSFQSMSSDAISDIGSGGSSSEREHVGDPKPVAAAAAPAPEAPVQTLARRVVSVPLTPSVLGQPASAVRLLRERERLAARILNKESEYSHLSLTAAMGGAWGSVGASDGPLATMHETPQSQLVARSSSPPPHHGLGPAAASPTPRQGPVVHTSAPTTGRVDKKGIDNVDDKGHAASQPLLMSRTQVYTALEREEEAQEHGALRARRLGNLLAQHTVPPSARAQKATVERLLSSALEELSEHAGLIRDTRQAIESARKETGRGGSPVEQQRQLELSSDYVARARDVKDQWSKLLDAVTRDLKVMVDLFGVADEGDEDEHFHEDAVGEVGNTSSGVSGVESVGGDSTRSGEADAQRRRESASEDAPNPTHRSALKKNKHNQRLWVVGDGYASGDSVGETNSDSWDADTDRIHQSFRHLDDSLRARKQLLEGSNNRHNRARHTHKNQTNEEDDTESSDDENVPHHNGNQFSTHTANENEGGLVGNRNRMMGEPGDALGSEGLELNNKKTPPPPRSSVLTGLRVRVQELQMDLSIALSGSNISNDGDNADMPSDVQQIQSQLKQAQNEYAEAARRAGRRESVDQVSYLGN